MSKYRKSRSTLADRRHLYAKMVDELAAAPELTDEQIKDKIRDLQGYALAQDYPREKLVVVWALALARYLIGD